MFSARMDSGGTTLNPTWAPKNIAASPSASGRSGEPLRLKRVSWTPAGRRPDRWSDAHLAALRLIPIMPRFICAASMNSWSSSGLSAIKQRSSANASTRGHLKSIGSDAPNTIQDMCAFIKQKNVVNIYPYIDISLRMLLCTPISNCSTERSFSALKRVKSYLRSCSKENRLNSLAMMTIEVDLTSKIDYNGVIEEFASLKCRKKLT
ncbi:zinc finger MYM-type protein 1-like [Aphis craccivora]|uniref:Zinc finger MYM-type protein 1-like n=1 Tax=Aphis craccivora TaxID=307492 RepID=A0A6G0XZ13_APHCR|nr:zinc finger MYM-type protein 1-like [Aphis craccivora]